MYKRHVNAWTKHIDFIIIDLLCMQLAFMLSFWLNDGIGNPYVVKQCLYQIAVLSLSQVAVILFADIYSGVLRRGAFSEALAVLKNALLVLVVAVVYLFIVHDTADVSRLQIGFSMAFFVVFSYAFRQLNKQRILRSGDKRKKSMVLVTSPNIAERTIESLMGGAGYRDYFLSAVLLFDYEGGAELPDYGIPVVPLSQESVLEVSRGWVDEIFILQPDDMLFPSDLMNSLMETGVTVNYAPIAMADGRWPVTDVREVGGYKVFTTGSSAMTVGQAAVKRIGDIIGGVIGCIVTAVLFVFIAPAIYAKSPGPIFFKQKRIGRNGRTFNMYKFRSMYLDAEERKSELAALNKVGDGMMFKVDGDPRIIGSEKRRPDGSPGGIGNFIRRTSVDEFPQFFNVLKGDMSLVGTRPPTIDEWERYSLWHRSRMSVKPGITGMWQVSGRSTITDFDEVVRLDRQYIEGWSLLLDVKIILKTIVVVAKRSGAE